MPSSRPRRWDIKFIRRFMIVFGLVSSVCDYLTFGVLLLVMHANTAQFRTGWFMESVVTAALIVLVIRTRKRFYQSRPSTASCWRHLRMVALALCPALHASGPPVWVSCPCRGMFLLALGLIMVFYVVVAETAKASSTAV